jgi:hypothetical protein
VRNHVRAVSPEELKRLNVVIAAENFKALATMPAATSKESPVGLKSSVALPKLAAGGVVMLAAAV